MTMRNLALTFLAYQSLALPKHSNAFVVQRTIADSRLVPSALKNVASAKKRRRHHHYRGKKQYYYENIREKSRWIFQSTTDGGGLGGLAYNNDDSDDDFVFIAPHQALYTDEDPNDQRYGAQDWLANVKSLPRSTILKSIQGPVVSVMVWSFVVSLVHGLFRKFGPRGWSEAMCISNKPHSFLVSALGLLLVFRTNSAYQRFAEGRKIWENILSISRNISRLSCLYERDMGEERRQRVFRLLGAFPYLLHHHIQPQCLDPAECKDVLGTKYAMELAECADPEDNILNVNNGNVLSYLFKQFRSQRNRFLRREKQSTVTVDEEDHYCGVVDEDDCKLCMVDRRALPWCLLPPSALYKCVDSMNRPLWICDRLSQELTDVEYSDNFTSRERLAFLSQVDKLSKCIGECERITQTAVPLNYARHSLRSLTIWLFTLPFALVGEFSLLTAPVMGVISWLMFGVYQIGSTIEDPFQGSLRLNMLCDAVYKDVMYDADLKNKRDSAFELEEELYEWDSMGPIEDSKLLLSAPPPQSNLPPPASPPPSSSTTSTTNSNVDKEPSRQQDINHHMDPNTVEYPLYNPDLPDPLTGGNPPSGDPMQPRP